jgi:hypothetical protein
MTAAFAALEYEPLAPASMNISRSDGDGIWTYERML